MRLVEEVVAHDPGVSARARRATRPDDWFFQGHFPGDPVVPAIVLVELVAQTGGVAASRGGGHAMRVAALGAFKFPDSAGPGSTLEVSAHVVGRFGGLVKVKGEVLADGRTVASGSLTLAERSP